MPQFQIPTGFGTTATATTSTDLQTAFVAEFIAIAAALPISTQTVFTAIPAHDTYLLQSPDLIDLPQGIDTIEGTAAIQTAQVLLAGSSATYVTDLTGVSTVVAGDNTSSTIINNNPSAALIAVTGAGENVLEGLDGANVFITGNGGADNVTLDGFYNTLTSNGNDAVTVGGAATVTATAGGDDGIQLLPGATLAFLNTSSSPMQSVVDGAANTITDLVGQGSTSVTAGNGNEYFFVDTSAGNVTLNANPNAFTGLTFVRDAAVGTANIVVQNLGAADYVAIHGYAGSNIAASATTPNSSVLALSDGSQITFVGVSVAQVQAGVRVV